MPKKRIGGRIVHTWVDEKATHEAAVRKWGEELVRAAAFRGVLAERAKLLSLLQRVDGEIASEIYTAACDFMGDAMALAIAFQATVQEMELSTDVPDDAAVDEQLAHLLKKAGCLGFSFPRRNTEAISNVRFSRTLDRQCRSLMNELDGRYVVARLAKVEQPSEVKLTPYEISCLRRWKDRRLGGEMKAI